MSIAENQETCRLGPELNGPEAKTYRTDILPGFELPIERVFAAADRWGKD
jgi:hypothetical protein